MRNLLAGVRLETSGTGTSCRMERDSNAAPAGGWRLQTPDKSPRVHNPWATNVLFLCTGNSAGSHPKGTVHPLTLAVLETCGLLTTGLASKSWERYAGDEAPHMDVVITVCDQAAGEACPLWPGAPVKVHWGLPDPAAAEGSEAARLAAFAATFTALEKRIDLLLG